jgi:hypothetical protein
MALIALAFAGVMAWFAKLQYQPTPRFMMRAVAVGAVVYAAWLFRYEPHRAWEIRWIGRAIAGFAYRIVDTLVP